MPSPVAYFFDQQAQLGDIKRVLRQLNRTYTRCHVSGTSLALLALECDMADAYFIEDHFNILRVLRDSPQSFLSCYQTLLREYILAEKKSAFFNRLQSAFNKYILTKNTTALDVIMTVNYLFLLLHADVTPQSFIQGVNKPLQLKLTSKSGVLAVDKTIEDIVWKLHHLLNARNITFVVQLPANLQSQLTTNDIVLLDLLCPGLYPAEQEKLNLQKVCTDFVKYSTTQKTSFLIFNGILGLKNLHPIFWQNYVFHLSGGSNIPFGKYIENVYCSGDIGELLKQHENLGRFQPPFHCIFETHAALHPNQPALHYGEQVLTYETLNAEANKLANQLLQCGLQAHLAQKKLSGKEVIVAIYLDPGFPLEIAVLAVRKTGAAFLLTDTNESRFPRKACYERLKQSGACFLLTHEYLYQELLTEEQALEKAKKINWQEMHFFALSQWNSYNSLAPENHALSVLTYDLELPVKSRDLADVRFTSGSTGKPKGIKVSNTLAYPLAAHQLYLNAGPGNRIAKIASDNFDASLMERAIALGTGAALYLFNKTQLVDLESFAELLTRYQIDIAIFTPNLLRKLNPEKLPYLKTIFIVGDEVDPALAEEWCSCGIIVYIGWGMNETDVCGALGRYHKHEPVNIGQSIFGMDFYIRPLAESLHDLEQGICTINERTSWIREAGEEGVLYVAGPSLFLGYLGRPDLDQRNLHTVIVEGKRTRIFCTSDRAAYLPDGRWQILGRIGEEVKISGQRVDLSEVAARIKENQGVEEVRVLCRVKTLLSGEKKKFLAAYIVPQDKSLVMQENQEISQESLDMLREIRLQLTAKMFAYKVPALLHMWFVSALPRKRNDKMQYDDAEIEARTPHAKFPRVKSAEEALFAYDEEDYPFIAQIRQLVAEIVELAPDQIAYDADLLEFGLDSLDITALLIKIKELPFSDAKLIQAAKSLTVSAFLEQPFITGIWDTLNKDVVMKRAESFDRQEMLKTLPRSSTEWMMLEEFRFYLREEKFFGKAAIPCYAIPGIFGDARMDYENTVIGGLPFNVIFTDMPPLNILSPLSNVKEIGVYIGETILAQTKNQDIIFIIAWSSGHLIAGEIIKYLREKRKNAFGLILDSTHPQLLQQSSAKQHAWQLLALAEKMHKVLLLELGLSGHQEFTLPNQQQLESFTDKNQQTAFFFSAVYKTLEQLIMTIPSLDSGKIGNAQRVILSAEILHKAELNYEGSQSNFQFGSLDVLIAAEASIKIFGNTLGWNIPNEAGLKIIKDVDHFSLLQSVALQQYIVPFFAQQLKAVALPLYDGIAALEVDRDYQRALELFNQAERIDWKVNFYRGLAYYKLENFQAALKDFEMARSLSTDDETIALNFFWMAKVQIKLTAYSDAIESLNAAVLRNPELMKVAYYYYFISRCCLIASKREAPVVPENIISHPVMQSKILCFMYVYSHVSANKNFLDAATLGNAKIDCTRGVLLLDEAIDLDPSNALAYFHRGKTHLKAENFAQACADFEQACVNDYLTTEVYYYYGLAELLRDNLYYAYAWFSRSIKLAAGDENNVHLLISHYCRAIVCIKLAQKLAQGNAKHKYFWERAIKDFNICKSYPLLASVEFFLYRGVAYQARANYNQLNTKRAYYNYKKAFNDFTTIVKLEPNYFLAAYQAGLTAKALANLCKPHHAQKQFYVRAAVGYLEKAASIFSSSPALWKELAYAYYELAFSIKHKTSGILAKNYLRKAYKALQRIPEANADADVMKMLKKLSAGLKKLPGSHNLMASARKRHFTSVVNAANCFSAFFPAGNREPQRNHAVAASDSPSVKSKLSSS